MTDIENQRKSTPSECRRGYSSSMGNTGLHWFNRYQVWLRDTAVWCLHGSYQGQGGPLLRSDDW